MRVSALLLAACCLASCGDNEAADNMMNVDDVAASNVDSGEPRVFCEAVRERVTEDECTDLTALKEDVRTGAAALNAPKTMTRSSRRAAG